MDDFRPFLTGFAPTIAPAPSVLANHQETDIMGITADNADRIHDLIVANGGSLPAAELRELVADMDATSRRIAVKLLREQGRVDSTGATSLIVYHATGPGRRNESPRNGADAGMEEKPSAAPAGATAAAPTSPLANVATPVAERAPASQEQRCGMSAEVQLINSLEQAGMRFLQEHPDNGDALRRAAAWFSSKFSHAGAVAP